MILALELLPGGARGHALDEAGAVQTARYRPLADALTPAQRWLQLIEMARDLSADVSLEAAQFARILLIFFGELDANGVVKAGAQGFDGYDLKRGLREHLHTGNAELVVASTAVADAWAQTQAGVLRDVNDWIYLSIDERLESVACVRGQWLQPDLGALVLERGGALDGAGRRGTWSAYCAGQSFVERARSYSLNVAASQIWTLAVSNFAAQSLAHDYVSRLAQGLANSVAALCPQRLCIGGALGREIFSQIHDELASELRDYGGAHAWNGDLVLSAASDERAQSIASGALALATLGAPPLHPLTVIR